MGLSMLNARFGAPGIDPRRHRLRLRPGGPPHHGPSRAGLVVPPHYRVRHDRVDSVGRITLRYGWGRRVRVRMTVAISATSLGYGALPDRPPDH